jgi:hypothetical protein
MAFSAGDLFQRHASLPRIKLDLLSEIINTRRCTFLGFKRTKNGGFHRLLAPYWRMLQILSKVIDKIKVST